MKLSKYVYATTVVAFLLNLMCVSTSSRLVDIWNDPVDQVLPLRKVLVIAVRKNATKRRIWEDAFSNGLAKQGVAATPSYSLYSDVPPNPNQIVEAVVANGFDAIMVILNLPSDTNIFHVDGYTTVEKNVQYPLFDETRPRYVYREYPLTGQEKMYDTYWQRYRTNYREIENPGYTNTQTTDIRTIDVTTTGKSGRLIWSATSRTPDPGSVTDVQRRIADLVMSELIKKNIIRELNHE